MSDPIKSQSKVEDPDHPIIFKPWTYRIISLLFEKSSPQREESIVELLLQREQEVRRLRFLGVEDIHIDSGFPDGGGLFISDVSARNLDGLSVRVGDFESSGGGIWFWARDVVEITKPTDTASV